MQIADIDNDGDADLLTSTGYLRNTRLQLTAPRLPLLGANYTLELRRVPAEPATTFAVFSGSAGRSEVPGVRGLLMVDLQAVEIWASGQLVGNQVAFARRVPASAPLLGLPFVSQAVIIDSLGIQLSNAISEVVQ